MFERYIGNDYSGAETADSSCKGLRVPWLLFTPASYFQKYHLPLRTLVRFSNSRSARSQSCSAYPS